MPNSGGSGAISLNCSADHPVDSNGSTIHQNGVHEKDSNGRNEDHTHQNGEICSDQTNGIKVDDTYTTSEISESSPLTMKIIRKRPSDMDISHESSKKSKLTSDHLDFDKEDDNVSSIETSSKQQDDDVIAVEPTKLEKPTIKDADHVTNKELPIFDTSSSSSIVLGDLEESNPNSAVTPDVKSKDNDKEDELVNSERKPESFENEADKSQDSIPTKDYGVKVEREVSENTSPIRDDVIDVYHKHLKKAVTCSIASLQRITQGLALHNNDWQAKYHQLHNRFLHLKVCTDKIAENAAKDSEKQLRSIEAQTDGPEDGSNVATHSNGLPLLNPNPTQRQTTVAAMTSKPVGGPQSLQNDFNQQTHQGMSTQPSSLPAQPPLQQLPTQLSASGPPNQLQQHQQHQQQQQQVVIVSPSTNQPAVTGTRLLAIAAQSGANVIDLTEDDASAQSLRTPGVPIASSRMGAREGMLGDSRIRHPMPLPRMTSPVPTVTCRGLPPPSPYLTVSPTEDGVCLKWNIPNWIPNVYSKLKRYLLFNYSKTPQSVFFSFQNPWKEIGSVDSMDLPMACTLTQIQSNSVYYFAIRPVDEYERLGIWSNTATIELTAVDS